jgi:hypothetical protein
MAGSHNMNSWFVTAIAGGVINPGHGVVLSAPKVVQCTSAQTAIGVYVGTEDAADGDVITICIGGPCQAFCDGTSAIAAYAVIANDTSGHFVVDTTDKHKLAGIALEPLASGTGLIEICFVPASFNAA